MKPNIPFAPENVNLEHILPLDEVESLLKGTPFYAKSKLYSHAAVTNAILFEVEDVVRATLKSIGKWLEEAGQLSLAQQVLAGDFVNPPEVSIEEYTMNQTQKYDTLTARLDQIQRDNAALVERLNTESARLVNRLETLSNLTYTLQADVRRLNTQQQQGTADHKNLAAQVERIYGALDIQTTHARSLSDRITSLEGRPVAASGVDVPKPNLAEEIRKVRGAMTTTPDQSMVVLRKDKVDEAPSVSNIKHTSPWAVRNRSNPKDLTYFTSRESARKFAQESGGSVMDCRR